MCIIPCSGFVFTAYVIVYFLLNRDPDVRETSLRPDYMVLECLWLASIVLEETLVSW